MKKIAQFLVTSRNIAGFKSTTLKNVLKRGINVGEDLEKLEWKPSKLTTNKKFYGLFKNKKPEFLIFNDTNELHLYEEKTGKQYGYKLNAKTLEEIMKKEIGSDLSSYKVMALDSKHYT